MVNDLIQHSTYKQSTISISEEFTEKKIVEVIAMYEY